MIGTKNYYTNPMSHIARSYEQWTDLGYSLDIPWNAVYTAGFFNKGDFKHSDGLPWGTERELVTRNDPEYYAPDDMIRSNVIPEINTHNPIYSYDRKRFTFKI